MVSEELRPDEIIALTGGAKTLHRQVLALVRLGLPFRFAGRSLHVKRAVAEEWPQWQERRQQGGVRLDLVS